MHKVEHKDYGRGGPDKDKQKDRVPNKIRRKVAADYIVKQDLTYWGTHPMILMTLKSLRTSQQW